MDLVSTYTMMKKPVKDDDFVSEGSSQFSNATENNIPDYAEIMGAEEVSRKGDPKRGRKYFYMNLIMMIVLSFLVLWNTSKVRQVAKMTENEQPVNENTNASEDCLAILSDP